jgi:hypothetical protein
MKRTPLESLQDTEIIGEEIRKAVNHLFEESPETGPSYGVKITGCHLVNSDLGKNTNVALQGVAVASLNASAKIKETEGDKARIEMLAEANKKKETLEGTVRANMAKLLITEQAAGLKKMTEDLEITGSAARTAQVIEAGMRNGTIVMGASAIAKELTSVAAVIKQLDTNSKE